MTSRVQRVGWGSTTQAAKAAALLRAFFSTHCALDVKAGLRSGRETEILRRSTDGLDIHLLEGGKPPNNKDLNYNVMSME